MVIATDPCERCGDDPAYCGCRCSKCKRKVNGCKCLVDEAAALSRTPVHLVTFRVPGRPITWSVSRRGTKPARLKQWQARVQAEGRIAWGLTRVPYRWPVGLSIWFYLHDPGGLDATTPDLTNLVKATEDGCKGAVLSDDRLVCSTHAERYWIDPTEEQRAWVQVWSLPDGGRVEPPEGIPYTFRPWEWNTGARVG